MCAVENFSYRSSRNKTSSSMFGKLFRISSYVTKPRARPRTIRASAFLFCSSIFLTIFADTAGDLDLKATLWGAFVLRCRLEVLGASLALRLAAFARNLLAFTAPLRRRFVSFLAFFLLAIFQQ